MMAPGMPVGEFSGAKHASTAHLLQRRRAATAAQPQPPLVVCGDRGRPKRDASGKKRRPAKSDTATESSAASQGPPPPAPRRVTADSPIPVRRQITFVQERKKAEKAPSLLQKRLGQAFRKETTTAEEYKQQQQRRREEALRLSKQQSKNFALSSLYQSDRPGIKATPPKILLVDAYNVIHEWPPAEALVGAGDLDAARSLLKERLATYSHCNKVRVSVVFDALEGRCKSTTEELLPTGVTEVYCGDQEADTYIEAQVEHFLEQGFTHVVVATSDRLHADFVRDKKCKERQTCHVVSAGALLNDMERTERAMEELKFGRGYFASRPSHSGQAVQHSGGDPRTKLLNLRNAMIEQEYPVYRNPARRNKPPSEEQQQQQQKDLV